MLNSSDISSFMEESLKDIQTSPVECLGKILERICCTTGCNGVILTHDEQGKALGVDVVYGYKPKDAKKLRSDRLKLPLKPRISVSTEAFLEASEMGAATPKLVPGGDPLSHSITEEQIEEVLGYAISSMGEWVGALTLESPRKAVLEKLKNSEDGRHWLEIFSAVLSTAFAARQSLVFRFNEFINQSQFTDVETLSRETLDWVFNKFKVNSCAMYFIKYDELARKDYLACFDAVVNRKKEPENEATKIRYEIGEGLVGWVAEIQHSLILTEVENSESKELDGYQRDHGKRPQRANKLTQRHPNLNFRSYIGVPITDGQETFGVLDALDTERDYAFSDEGLLEMIARRIAAEYKRILTNIKRESVFEIPKLDTRSLERVVDGVVKTAKKVAAATDAFFMLKEAGGFTPMSIEGHNLLQGDIPPMGMEEKNLIHWVMEEYKEVNCPDLKAGRNSPPEDMDLDRWKNSFERGGFIPEHMRSLLMVPVYLGSPHGYDDADDGGDDGAQGGGEAAARKVEDLGVLVLMSTKPNAFEQDDVVITALAQIVAYHIWANKKINELESRKAEIFELRQLMPKYEHATLVASVASGTMHTVRNHVGDVKKALDALLAVDKIRGDAEVRKLADLVRKPFDDLTNLYDRLFRSVFGDFKPQFEGCDIADQVQEARDYMEPTFRKRGVNFKSFLRDANLPMVRADSILMRVVFINFFKNSIEANARNITVRGSKILDEGLISRVMVELRFEDDGFGIPKDSWKAVFKPFETANKKGGTGLGLAVNKEIMNKHEGDVRVESSVIDGKDHGTVITITLPVSE